MGVAVVLGMGNNIAAVRMIRPFVLECLDFG